MEPPTYTCHVKIEDRPSLNKNNEHNDDIIDLSRCRSAGYPNSIELLKSNLEG